jgi:hypothetical protein
VPGLEHLTADLLVEGVLPLLGPRPAE